MWFGKEICPAYTIHGKNVKTRSKDIHQQNIKPLIHLLKLNSQVSVIILSLLKKQLIIQQQKIKVNPKSLQTAFLLMLRVAEIRV